MAKKCLGIREDTGDQCQRSASRDSDFCFMHQSQEGNQKVQHVDDDVYYCPHDGKKLLYDPKRDYHRCKKCRGSLFSGKMISSDYARKISQSSQVQHEEKCCSCGFEERRITDYRVPLKIDFLDGDTTNHKLDNIKSNSRKNFNLYIIKVRLFKIYLVKLSPIID